MNRNTQRTSLPMILFNPLDADTNTDKENNNDKD